jgi:hypothetical protein
LPDLKSGRPEQEREVGFNEKVYFAGECGSDGDLSRDEVGAGILTSRRTRPVSAGGWSQTPPGSRMQRILAYRVIQEECYL